ncbi:Uncharacterised protein [Salmonella enterica subsp. salamae]|uniref:Uncharacterized protein n=1 Tax=Salmonella enterica TaxID=28901 RepID=A0A379SHS8_SALER|nr:Uncharacterised protein [Salmonella enterica]SUJ08003.1 Uncharacterised protein [Salmonella enterica subsp. salamae]
MLVWSVYEIFYLYHNEFFFSVSVWGGIVQREVLNLKQRNVLESIINNQVNNDNDRLFVRNTWSEAKLQTDFNDTLKVATISRVVMPLA